MQTYPYPTPDGIIDLVRKTEFDRLKWELEETKTELKNANRGAERNAKANWELAGHVNEARAKLAKWQTLAGHLAEALKDCKNRAMDKSIETHADDYAKGCLDEIWEWSESALAAYESVAKDHAVRDNASTATIR